ncbi:MAG: VF530 family protein [Bacteroidota bacterium]
MQPNNPLHGLTLEQILLQLKAHFGFRKLGQMIPVRCFILDPSIKSSLVFLRKTDWARLKVEELYLKTAFNPDTFKLVEEEYFAQKQKKIKPSPNKS